VNGADACGDRRAYFGIAIFVHMQLAQQADIFSSGTLFDRGGGDFQITQHLGFNVQHAGLGRPVDGRGLSRRFCRYGLAGVAFATREEAQGQQDYKQLYVFHGRTPA
jgi:hypothetical protein